jgi:hypothetical protein
MFWFLLTLLLSPRAVLSDTILTLRTGSQFPGTCALAMVNYLTYEVRCETTHFDNGTSFEPTCGQLTLQDNIATLMYVWEIPECSEYLLHSVYTQLEDFLLDEGIHQIFTRDGSYIFPWHYSSNPIPTVLCNSIFDSIPTSYFHLLGFENTEEEKDRLDEAFERLQQYSVGDFASDVRALHISNGRDFPFDHHNFNCFAGAVHDILYSNPTSLSEAEHRSVALDCIFSKIEELGNHKSHLFYELSRKDRMMVKSISRPSKRRRLNRQVASE